MVETRNVKLDEIVKYFYELEDPRSETNKKHPLVSVVVIAVLAGCGGPTTIARWARTKEEFLLGVLDLPHGIPWWTHCTIRPNRREEIEVFNSFETRSIGSIS